jgi:soluble lytic murein transglycosylase-like protein
MRVCVWTFRTPVRHLSAGLVLTLMVLALTGLLAAQSLQPTSQNGHIVWTNDGPAATDAPDKPTHASNRGTNLFYWSNTGHCWKPVRPATPAAMRSARAVAGEVTSYIDAHPRLDSGAAQAVKGELARQNPNYSKAAGDRSVTSVEIDRYINEAAARHHVNPNLVRALVKVESNFNPSAVSRKGAMGLMQLMPATARMYDLHNPFDAKQNVDAGVRHLKGLLESFGGDVSLSLAAYNAGQGAVERNRGIPPYAETRNYVKRITGLMGSSDISQLGYSHLPIPIEVHRDEHGRLVISNTD